MEIEGNGICGDVLPEDYLELVDRESVKSLAGLIEVLKKMKEGEFLLHVSRHYNDFAEWIADAYGEKELAGKVGKIGDRGKMIRFLQKVLARAEKRRFEKGGKRDVLKKIGKME